MGLWLFIYSFDGENPVNILAKSVVVHLSVWNLVHPVVVDKYADFFFGHRKIGNVEDARKLG